MFLFAQSSIDISSRSLLVGLSTLVTFSCLIGLSTLLWDYGGVGTTGEIRIFLHSIYLIYWERGEWGWRGRERESQAGSALSVQGPAWDSNPQTVRSWPEPKPSWMLTDWATQTPLLQIFLKHSSYKELFWDTLRLLEKFGPFWPCFIIWLVNFFLALL